MEQFSGQFSETSTGLNKFGQHSSLAQTRRQKFATWSDVRTILTTALYVLPLYLEKKKKEEKVMGRPNYYTDLLYYRTVKSSHFLFQQQIMWCVPSTLYTSLQSHKLPIYLSTHLSVEN
jgi:hypothetical protein